MRAVNPGEIIAPPHGGRAGRQRGPRWVRASGRRKGWCVRRARRWEGAAVHAARASRGRPGCPPPWRAGPARGATVASGAPGGETDASLSAAAATRPVAPHGRAARPGCAGIGGSPRAPTRSERACCPHSRKERRPRSRDEQRKKTCRHSGRPHTPKRSASTRLLRAPASGAAPRSALPRVHRPAHSHTWARRLRRAVQPSLEGLSSSWAHAAPNSTGRAGDAQLFSHRARGAMPFRGRELQATGPKTCASWRPSTVPSWSQPARVQHAHRAAGA